MAPPTASEIRQRFLDFFAQHGHAVVRSSSLVPINDPTLLFTNAGMNQFKDLFLGREKRDYTTATSTQKCVRAGGKHNDLENVGFTARHHTFFEMLGNFSFGDYFKEEAIQYAWDFLVKELGIPVDKLWITVFREDDEAAEIWEKTIGVSPDRIVRCGEKDNFWQMGDTGPCGPCSEIHFDQGTDLPCPEPECLGVECECDRILEIWNLVFMQYDRDTDGTLNPLPSPSIDTGMGLERVAAVVQGHQSNYDVDLLRDIITKVEQLSGKTYGADGDDDVSMRVIADHARATAFLVADGVMPDKDGRGYVLRRIMRRGIRHGKRLGFETLFLPAVCDTVVDIMGEAFPELEEQRAFISKVAQQEEEAFRRTLDRGLKILEEALVGLGDDAVLDGQVAFKLYDTYGFPFDLTQVICAENDVRVDAEGFDAALKEQQDRSTGGLGTEGFVEDVYMHLAEEHGGTVFTGYESAAGEGTIVAILRDGQATDTLNPGESGSVLLDRTPFYAESGGQVGDTGTLGEHFTVTDTKKIAGLHVHEGKLAEGSLKVGDTLGATVDADRRARIKANHSATHLLHLALQELLGDHARQKGSLVAPELLRFDFAHFEPLTDEQMEQLEARVNELIAHNAPTHVKELPFDEAREAGAMAMFGEKYGDEVRTVRIADDSFELCGGTHVDRAGDIGMFKLVSDASIAAGVRRVVAYTRLDALRHVQEEERKLKAAAASLKASPKNLDEKADQAARRLKELEREVEQLQQKLATAKSVDFMDSVREVNGVQVLAIQTQVDNPKALRDLADKLRDKLGSGVVALGAESSGKAHLLVAVTRDLTERLKAAELIREMAPMVGGRGGGKPELAQAGGDDPAHLQDALDKVYDLIPAA